MKSSDAESAGIHSFRGRFNRKRILFNTVLLLTVMACGWVGWRVWMWHVYRDVQRWVDSHNGNVAWGFEKLPGRTADSMRTPKLLKDFCGQPVLDDIAGVTLTSPGIREEELKRLRLPRLTHFHLGGTIADDSYVEEISKMRGVIDLWIYDCDAVTDRSFELVSGMPNVRKLVMGDSRSDGDALRFLAEMNQLESLYIHDPDIVDEDLRHLSGMT